MRPGCLRIVALGLVYVVLVEISPGRAPDAAVSDEDVVVATVGGEPVYRSEVERLLDRVIGDREVDPAVLPIFQAHVLSEIVDRYLVLAYARRTKSGASASEVDAAVAEFASSLEAQGRSLEEHLKERSISKADFRRQIAWRLTWWKYREKYITKERLASYFESHRRELDGTQVAVSHILLQSQPGSNAAAADELIEKARTIRGEIASGKLTFAEAAGKYSAGPSGKDGGSLGFIGRKGPMVESFSKAAFSLEAGQVSQPVVTPFGVHLIRCDEIKPGSRQPADVRPELEEALGRDLLEKLARHERQHAPVEFTGAAPYFKPATRELVAP